MPLNYRGPIKYTYYMSISYNKIRYRAFKRGISFIVGIFISGLIIFPTTAHTQAVPTTRLGLPAVGEMVLSSPAFTPVRIKGVRVFPDNPLRFDFIVDAGDSGLEGLAFEKESTKLIKYFLASLTVPEKDMWVNLSPYEKDRIIPEKFGVTEMGRDLLAQDYVLKQLTASLMYPEEELGEEFWSRVHEQAYEKYGTIRPQGGETSSNSQGEFDWADIPVDTFNKVWIMPEKAVVYENVDRAFVVESRLKVMLEEDYIAVSNNVGAGPRARPVEGPPQGAAPTYSNITTSIIREIILPAIEQEVNEGKNFAPLRQIYQSMILAIWYKEKIKSSLLSAYYVNQNKVSGVDIEDKAVKEKIYAQYMEAFKTGIYDYIKEDYDPTTQQIIPRKYFSGGFIVHEDFGMVVLNTNGRMDAVAVDKEDYIISSIIDPIDNAMQSQVIERSVISGPGMELDEQTFRLFPSEQKNIIMINSLIGTKQIGSFNLKRDENGNLYIKSSTKNLRYQNRGGSKNQLIIVQNHTSKISVDGYAFEISFSGNEVKFNGNDLFQFSEQSIFNLSNGEKAHVDLIDLKNSLTPTPFYFTKDSKGQLTFSEENKREMLILPGTKREYGNQRSDFWVRVSNIEGGFMIENLHSDHWLGFKEEIQIEEDEIEEAEDQGESTFYDVITLYNFLLQLKSDSTNQYTAQKVIEKKDLFKKIFQKFEDSKKSLKEWLEDIDVTNEKEKLAYMLFFRNLSELENLMEERISLFEKVEEVLNTLNQNLRDYIRENKFKDAQRILNDALVYFDKMNTMQQADIRYKKNVLETAELLHNWDKDFDKDIQDMQLTNAVQKLGKVQGFLEFKERKAAWDKYADAINTENIWALPSAQRDYYGILNLDKTASEDDIKQSRRNLALKYHPDKTPDSKLADIKIKLITEAFGVLSDSARREAYDVDHAQLGGISLDPAGLDFQVQNEGEALQFDFDSAMLQNMSIDGFSPRIINVAPVVSVPMVLGQNRH